MPHYLAIKYNKHKGGKEGKKSGGGVKKRLTSPLNSCVGRTKVKIMVSTRRGDCSTPEKNPPRPSNVLLHRTGPATRRMRLRRTRLSQRQLIMLPHLHSTMSSMQMRTMLGGGNDDADGDNRGIDDHGMNDNEGEQQVKEDIGEVWKRARVRHQRAGGFC